HVARYVASVMARYGGRHPLGAPIRLQQDATSPATVAWLLEELVRLPRHHGELANDGGALITIARRAGNDPATYGLQAAIDNRTTGQQLHGATDPKTPGGKQHPPGGSLRRAGPGGQPGPARRLHHRTACKDGP